MKRSPMKTFAHKSTIAAACAALLCTGAFAQQVQEEVIEDRHPVIMVTGGDIARILIACELDVAEKLEAWLAGIRQKAKDDTPAP